LGGAPGAKPQAQRIESKGASGKTGENQGGILRRILTTAETIRGLGPRRKSNYQSKSKYSKKRPQLHFGLYKYLPQPCNGSWREFANVNLFTYLRAMPKMTQLPRFLPKSYVEGWVKSMQ
jgi:hypothetical protein